MPYKPTGNPPGRPRKHTDDATPRIERAPVAEPMPPLKRARAGFRRAFPDPADDLHRPPRFGNRRRDVGKRPMLHPNVIKG